MERIESQIGGVRDGPLPTSCYDEQSEHEVTRGGSGDRGWKRKSLVTAGKNWTMVVRFLHSYPS